MECGSNNQPISFEEAERRRKHPPCPFCGRKLSKSNVNRHEKSFHYLCPVCLRLTSAAKHGCFRVHSVSARAAAKPADAVAVGRIFVPMEMRSDCQRAMECVLAARDAQTDDVHSVALYLLAKLRRRCLGCMWYAYLHSEHAQHFHTCRLRVEDIMRENAYQACLIFGVTYSDETEEALRAFLIDNTVD